jgi:hypothetical protein
MIASVLAIEIGDGKNVATGVTWPHQARVGEPGRARSLGEQFLMGGT